MAESVNLRALIREVERESENVSPQAITEQVLARLRPRDYQAALHTALPVFVRQVQSEQRSRVLHISEPKPGGLSVAGESSRVAAVRDDWLRALGQTINLGAGVAKPLRECTRVDLLRVAAHLDERAQRNAMKAHEYRTLANLLDADDDKVGDLPAETLVKALGSAA